MLIDVKQPTKQYQVGDIITENIPFVSFDNLTKEGFLLFNRALLEAKNQGNKELLYRIRKSVRQTKKNSEISLKYLTDSINIFRDGGNVFYNDTITELEVFPWTFMTK